MSNVFAQGLGGISVVSSPTSEANIAKSNLQAKVQEDNAFAQKLKEVQEKTEQTRAIGAGRTVQEDAKLREVCKEMEAVFLNLMMSKMRDTIPERTLFPKSSGEKIMESMLDVEFTRSMAAGGGIGLGDLLYNQLSNPGVKQIPDNANVKKD